MIRLLARRLILIALLAASSTHAQTITGTAEPPSCVPAWFDPVPDLTDDSTIRSIARDPSGFVYLGGNSALYRIEGGTIRRWYPEPGNETALPAGLIRALVSDDTGLWLGTSVGLVRFEFATEQFTRVAHTPPDTVPGRVNALAIIGDRLYVGDAKGGAILDRRTNALLARWRFDDPDASANTRDIIEFDGSVFAATTLGVVRIAVDGRATTLAPFLEDGVSRANSVSEFAVSPEGELWGATLEGVAIARFGDGLTMEVVLDHRQPQLSGDEFEVLSFDSLGRLWIGSSDQLVRWDRGDAAPLRCREVIGSATDRDISVAFIDTEDPNLVSYGSYGSYYKAATLTPSSRRIVMGERYNPGLPKSVLWTSYLARDGRLYLGAQNGLFRQNAPGSNGFEQVAPDVIGPLRIRAVVEDAAGALWVGTRTGLFVVDDDGATELPRIRSASGVTTFPSIRVLHPVNDRMLAGATSGVLVYDQRTRTVQRLFRTRAGRVPPDNATVTQLSSTWITAIDSVGGDIYIAGNDAVYRVDIDTGEVLASTVPSVSNGTLILGAVQSVAAANDGESVFIGTEAGLVVTDRNFSAFETITQVGGTRLGSADAMARSTNGDIWYGATNIGLLRRSAATGQWSIYDERDGLQTLGFSSGGLTTTHDNQIIAVASSASLLHIDDLPVGTPATMDLFVSVDNGMATRTSGLTKVIGPDIRSVDIEFMTPAMLSELDPFAVEYELETPAGYEVSDTLPLGELLRLANLAPGRYALRARVMGVSGQMSATVALNLQVRANWWETRAAVLAGTTSIGLMLIGLVIWRSQVRLRRFELVADERRRIAQDLHDTFLQEVFAALTIGRQLSVEAGQRGDELERLNDLLETAARSARTSINELAESPDELSLMEALRDHEPPSLAASGIDLQITESGQPWTMSTERAFFLSRATKEAITNACKHSRAKTVRVSVDWDASSVKIVVSDDGRGFDVTAARQAGGFGLRAMTRLVREGGASQRIVSAPDQGTRVTFEARRAWA